MADKTCSQCGKTKPETKFYKSGRYRHSWCKPCLKKKRKQRPYDPEYARRQHLEKHYGITLEEYAVMYANQGGMCAICSTTACPTQKRFAVDHIDTPDGPFVRGLLDTRCNQALGQLQENQNLAATAAVYLHTSGAVDPDYEYTITVTNGEVVFTSGVR